MTSFLSSRKDGDEGNEDAHINFVVSLTPEGETSPWLVLKTWRGASLCSRGQVSCWEKLQGSHQLTLTAQSQQEHETQRQKSGTAAAAAGCKWREWLNPKSLPKIIAKWIKKKSHQAFCADCACATMQDHFPVNLAGHPVLSQANIILKGC